jgi:Fe2+ transport system protein FeoA
VGLTGSGALEVRYETTSPDNIGREARRLRDMGLVEGRHFAVKKPEGGRDGYVSILREGLAYAARLSIHGSEEQRRFAAEFVSYILERAREEGDAVYRKG